MDFKKLAAKAKQTIDERGGVESLKGDADELRKVAQGKGSLADKAKAAAKAIKEPASAAKAKPPPTPAAKNAPPSTPATPPTRRAKAAPRTEGIP